MDDDAAVQTMNLPDGRRLVWREFRDSGGSPCIYTTGTPASSLAGALHHQAARAAGVRWISLDKPGCGGSDFQPGRRLLDWPGDVSALAAKVGLGRFGAGHTVAWDRLNEIMKVISEAP